MATKTAVREIFNGDAAFIEAFRHGVETCAPSVRSDVIAGMVAHLRAVQSGAMEGSAHDVVQRLVDASAIVDIRRERTVVSRKEKRGHADPTLECPRCHVVGSCISKQVHDRLGSDEGATRYVACSACGAVTRQR